MDRQESLDLLRRARAGSDGALEELHRRVAGKLLALIRLRMGPALRTRMESRDLLQAVLLKAVERQGQFAGEDTATLMAWLARIAANEIRDQADFHRRQRREAARQMPLDDLSREIEGRSRSALSKVIQDEEAERLEVALESLADDHREVILLRRFEELPFKEIAARMRRSEDACRMLFARAMTALTLRLEEGS